MQPGEFTSGSISNVVQFSVQRVAPPSTLYIQRDDQLVIEGFSILAGEIITLNARLLLASPEIGGQPEKPPPARDSTSSPVGGTPIKPIQTNFTLTSVTAPQVLLVPLAEGYLLSVTLGSNSANFRGLTFVRAWINRGKTLFNVPNAAQMLISHYVTAFQPVSWPGWATQDTSEGPGTVQLFTVANPAAGADWAFVCPAAVKARVQSFNAVFTAAAVVATRIPRVQVKRVAATLVWQAAPQQGITTGVIAQVSASDTTVNSVVDVTTVNLPIPGPLFIEPGDTVGVNTLAIQGADQWSAISLELETWMEQG